MLIKYITLLSTKKKQFMKDIFLVKILATRIVRLVAIFEEYSLQISRYADAFEFNVNF